MSSENFSLLEPPLKVLCMAGKNILTGPWAWGHTLETAGEHGRAACLFDFEVSDGLVGTTGLGPDEWSWLDSGRKAER